MSERYKYYGPTMLLGEYDQIGLHKGSDVEAEVMNTNVATITKIYDTDGSTTVLNDAATDVAAKYLEPVKPETIHFDPKDDVDVPHFFDNLFSDIAKINAEHEFPFAYTEKPFKDIEDHLSKWTEEHKQDLENNDAKNKVWEKIKKDFDWANEAAKYYTPKKVIDFLRKEARKRPDLDKFDRVLNEMSDTHVAKNHDYGNSFSDLFKELGMTYAYGHLKEKLERIRTLMKSRQQVKQESMLDSLYDLASYAVMTIVELKKKQDNVARD